MKFFLLAAISGITCASAFACARHEIDWGATALMLVTIRIVIDIDRESRKEPHAN